MISGKCILFVNWTFLHWQHVCVCAHVCARACVWREIPTHCSSTLKWCLRLEITLIPKCSESWGKVAKPLWVESQWEWKDSFIWQGSLMCRGKTATESEFNQRTFFFSSFCRGQMFSKLLKQKKRHILDKYYIHKITNAHKKVQCTFIEKDFHSIT